MMIYFIGLAVANVVLFYFISCGIIRINKPKIRHSKYKRSINEMQDSISMFFDKLKLLNERIDRAEEMYDARLAYTRLEIEKRIESLKSVEKKENE